METIMKLQDAFVKVYSNFKLHFYKKVFEKLEDRETSLTTVETFCMEIIYALGRPTVAQFSEVANLSSPNAAYKINNLVKKNYLRRVQSTTDRREFYLEVTDKYLNYYNISQQYVNQVMQRMQERFTEEELATLQKILTVMDEELMPEVQLKTKKQDK